MAPNLVKHLRKWCNLKKTLPEMTIINSTDPDSIANMTTDNGIMPGYDIPAE